MKESLESFRSVKSTIEYAQSDKETIQTILNGFVCYNSTYENGYYIGTSDGSSSGKGAKIIFTYSQEDGNAFRDTLAAGA